MPFHLIPRILRSASGRFSGVGGSFGARPSACKRCGLFGHGLELQAELDRWIEEALDGSKGMTSFSGMSLKDSSTSNSSSLHRQIPELVLEHDGHFSGIALAQALGDLHAGSMRSEGDVEVMLARASPSARRAAAPAAQRRARPPAPANHNASNLRPSPLSALRSPAS